MRMERECSVEGIHLLFKRDNFFANNKIYNPLLLDSRAQGVSGNNERLSQTPWRGPKQLLA